MKCRLKIRKIVSGGQTGADRAALDAAIAMRVAHGGWCPKGRCAEDGRIPARYRLRETSTEAYAERTEANVVDSDATLIFTAGPPEGGSRQTLEFALRHGRPWLHLDTARHPVEKAVQIIVKWLAALGTERRRLGAPNGIVLNVAGSRASADPQIYAFVRTVMERVLRDVNRRAYARFRTVWRELLAAASPGQRLRRSILLRKPSHRSNQSDR